MKRRTFFLGLAGLARLHARPAPAAERLQLVGLRRAGDDSRFRSGIRRARPLRHLREQRGDAGQGARAAIPAGTWCSPRTTACEPMRDYGLLAPLDHEWLPNLANLGAALPRAGVGSRTRVGRAVHVERHRHRLQPQSVARARARWADLWSSALKGRLTMLDDPEDMLGACLKKLRLSVQRRPIPRSCGAPEQEAIAQKPLLRAYLNAEVRDQLVAGDVLAAQLWSTTAQQAIDAAPQLAFVYPAEGFPFYCDCAVILRESRRDAGSRTSSWITCCGPRSRPASRRSPRPRRRTERRKRSCRRRSAIIPRFIRRPTYSRAASGRGRCRPRPSGCATASGPRSSPPRHA